MQTMPAIGTAVSFAGNLVIGSFKGTVVTCYPGHRGRNENGEFVVDDMVVVEVASLPTRWPYPGTNRFCAEITTLDYSTTR